MSTEAWSDYGVPGSPYFVLVEGRSGRVRGEGTGPDWEQVSSLLDQATGDAAHRTLAANRVPKPSADQDRESRIDAELLAAGVAPGDPSLYVPPVPAPDDEHGMHEHDHPTDAHHDQTRMSDTTPLGDPEAPGPDTAPSTSAAPSGPTATTAPSTTTPHHDGAGGTGVRGRAPRRGPGGQAVHGVRLRHRGRPPAGWEGRIAQRAGAPTAQTLAGRSVAPDGIGPAGSTEERSHPIAHLANFALPENRGDFGCGAVDVMGAGDVLVVPVRVRPRGRRASRCSPGGACPPT